MEIIDAEIKEKWNDKYLWTLIVNGGGVFCTTFLCRSLTKKGIPTECNCSSSNIFEKIDKLKKNQIFSFEELQTLNIHTNSDVL